MKVKAWMLGCCFRASAVGCLWFCVCGGVFVVGFVVLCLWFCVCGGVSVRCLGKCFVGWLA